MCVSSFSIKYTGRLWNILPTKDHNALGTKCQLWFLVGQLLLLGVVKSSSILHTTNKNKPVSNKTSFVCVLLLNCLPYVNTYSWPSRSLRLFFWFMGLGINPHSICSTPFPQIQGIIVLSYNFSHLLCQLRRFPNQPRTWRAGVYKCINPFYIYNYVYNWGVTFVHLLLLFTQSL